MRAEDIVAQLQRKLPLLTAEFSDEIAITSIVHAGTTATVTTAAPHGLVVGAAPTIFGARTPVAVASITHAANAKFAVVVTSEDHDLTLYRTFPAGNYVEVDGAVEADFEGVRKIVSVPNRRTVHVEVDPAAPASATGTIRLLGASNYFRSIRGRYAVTGIPAADQFTITHDAASDLGTLAGPAFLRTPARITAAISVEAAERSYSPEANGAPAKPWLYVILGDSIPVRSRETPPEAASINKLSGGWSQYVVQPFSLLVGLPISAQPRGRQGRDLAADLLAPLCRALLGYEFPTGFSKPSPASSVVFAGEESGANTVGAWYAHRYDFEQLARIDLDDTVGNEEHVAFRDITLEIGNDLGDSTIDSEIDLDETPLP